MRITSRHNLSSLQPARGILGVCKSTVGSWQNSILHPAVTYKECTKTLREQSSLLFLVCIHSNSVCSACMRPPMAIGMSFIVHTLFAHASSSQDVSCSTLMISLISALIFSKVKLRFFKASSTPWLPDVFVVTKILIPESQNKTHSVFALLKKKETNYKYLKKEIKKIKKNVITWDEDGQQLFDCVHGVDQHHTVLLVCQLLLSLIDHLCHLRHPWTQATQNQR